MDSICSYYTLLQPLFLSLRKFLCPRYLDPPTNVVYETFAKSKGFTPQTVTLDHGALGHWIGNKDAKNVLLYYHGMANPLTGPSESLGKRHQKP